MTLILFVIGLTLFFTCSVCTGIKCKRLKIHVPVSHTIPDALEIGMVYYCMFFGKTFSRVDKKINEYIGLVSGLIILSALICELL